MKSQLDEKQRKLLAYYLIWIMLHALLWIVWGEGHSDFWPFGGIQHIDDYGASEFFVYTGLPVGCYMVFLLLSPRDSSNEGKKRVIPERISKVSAVIITGISWFLVLFLFMLPIAIIGAKQPAPFYSFGALSIASAVATYVYKRIRGEQDDETHSSESDNTFDKSETTSEEISSANYSGKDCEWLSNPVISNKTNSNSSPTSTTEYPQREQKSDPYVVYVETNKKSKTIPFLIFFLVISIVLNIITGIVLNNLDEAKTTFESQLRDCESALTVKAIELGKLQKERDNLATFQNEIGKSIPVIITDIRMGNRYEDWRIATNYGDPILSSCSMFLAPRVFYCGVIPGKYEFKVKLYYPNGSLSTGTTSPEGCSYTYSAYIKAGRHDIEFSGWGGKNKGHYSPGTYRIEIWLNNVCLKQQSFKIY